MTNNPSGLRWSEGTGVALIQQRDVIQTAKLVASIDQVIPPAFWANAGPAAATSNGAAIANAPRYRFTFVHLPFAVSRPIVWALMQNEGYLSSQTSSMRLPLWRLLTMMVSPL